MFGKSVYQIGGYVSALERRRAREKSIARAYARGAAKAAECRRVFEAERIIIAANNPYADSELRDRWQAGFAAAYSGKAS